MSATSLPAVVKARRKTLARAVRDLSAAPTDPEAVHDFRVAARRLVAALHWAEAGDLDAKAHKLRKPVARARKALGPLRDAHVMRSQLGALPSDDPAVRALKRSTTARAARQTQLVRDRRDSLEFDAIWPKLKRLETRLAKRNKRTRRGALVAQARAAATDVIAHIDATRPAKPTTVHALRIAVKRLRYTLELGAEGPFPNWHGPVETTLKPWQQRLGESQDLSVLIDAFAALAQRPTPPTGAAAWVRRLRRRRRDAVDAAMRKLDDLRGAVEALAAKP